MANPYKPWPANLEENARKILALIDETSKALEYLITQASQHNKALCNAIIDEIPPDLETIKALTDEILYDVPPRGGWPMFYRNSNKVMKLVEQAEPIASDIKRAINMDYWKTTVEASKALLDIITKMRRLLLVIPFERKTGNGGNSSTNPQGYLVQGWPVSIKRTM